MCYRESMHDERFKSSYQIEKRRWQFSLQPLLYKASEYKVQYTKSIKDSESDILFSQQVLILERQLQRSIDESLQSNGLWNCEGKKLLGMLPHFVSFVRQKRSDAESILSRLLHDAHIQYCTAKSPQKKLETQIALLGIATVVLKDRTAHAVPPGSSLDIQLQKLNEVFSDLQVSERVLDSLGEFVRVAESDPRYASALAAFVRLQEENLVQFLHAWPRWIEEQRSISDHLYIPRQFVDSVLRGDKDEQQAMSLLLQKYLGWSNNIPEITTGWSEGVESLGGKELVTALITQKHILTGMNLRNYSQEAFGELYTRFGITQYGRYPYELLERQMNEIESDDLPSFLFLMGRTDYQGEFSKQEYRYMHTLSHELQGKSYVRIAEFSNENELLYRIGSLARRYGPHLGFILEAHGPVEIQLSTLSLTAQDIAEHEQEWKKRRADFVPGARGILDVCSTGRAGSYDEEGISIAEIIRDTFNITMTAPRSSTGLADVGVYHNPATNCLVITPHYTQQDVATYNVSSTSTPLHSALEFHQRALRHYKQNREE